MKNFLLSFLFISSSLFSFDPKELKELPMSDHLSALDNDRSSDDNDNDNDDSLTMDQWVAGDCEINH